MRATRPAVKSSMGTTAMRTMVVTEVLRLAAADVSVLAAKAASYAASASAERDAFSSSAAGTAQGTRREST